MNFLPIKGTYEFHKKCQYFTMIIIALLAAAGIFFMTVLSPAVDFYHAFLTTELIWNIICAVLVLYAIRYNIPSLIIPMIVHLTLKITVLLSIVMISFRLFLEVDHVHYLELCMVLLLFTCAFVLLLSYAIGMTLHLKAPRVQELMQTPLIEADENV